MHRTQVEVEFVAFTWQEMIDKRITPRMMEGSCDTIVGGEGQLMICAEGCTKAFDR